MSTTPTNQYDDKEINFSDLSKSVGSMFSRMNRFIFTSIQFFIRNIVILVILLVVGVGVGIYLDKARVYEHQIIVSPNFGSVDYLYSSIELINGKLKQGDTVFLKSIGIAKPSKLLKIEIAPIVDVYKFVNRTGKEIDFQMLKLMAENGDMKKIVEDPTTARNYTTHLITFSTRDKTTNSATVEPLLQYLNSSEFYKKLQQQTLINVDLKMQANARTIAQIDGLLDEMAKNDAASNKSNAIYVSENRQLNDVIVTKDNLLQEQAYLRLELVGYDKIVKANTIILNKSSKSAGMKILLPLALILIFLAITLFISFYKSQKRKFVATS